MNSSAKRAHRARRKSRKSERTRIRCAITTEVYCEAEYVDLLSSLAALKESQDESARAGDLWGMLDENGLGLVRYKPRSTRERAACIAAIVTVHARYCVCGIDELERSGG